MRRACVPVALLLLVAACSEPARPRSTVGVAAAFAPIAEAAARVGGDRVQIVDLTPAGSEPHDLELSPGQIEAVLAADLLVYIGGGFQPGVDELAGRRAEGSLNLSSGGDPHIWLDPVAWRDTVGEIAEALSEADPAGAGDYSANAEAYRTELTALDADFRAGLSDCARRVIVTAHEAFGRLTSRYRLEQIGIAGISPEAEPSAKRLAELRDLVRERGVTTIFTEVLVSPRVAETLARSSGARTAVLDPIESLSDGKTYLGQMLANLKVLREALECR